MSKYPTSLIKELKAAGTANKAPIWTKIAKCVTKSRVAHKVTNIKQIAKFSKDGDTIVFPGKVLGVGLLDHKITLCSFAISNTAAQKVLDAGGKIVEFSNIIKEKPTGTGVIILG